jgi:fructosamine-3-kinase
MLRLTKNRSTIVLYATPYHLLYKLYQLLNHVNTFGESYGAEVVSILRRYVG